MIATSSYALFSSSFTKSDLLEYCKLSNIPLSEHTIDCMFEEFLLNNRSANKNHEIDADDLISLIYIKKKRCFYIPVVVYIGKCNNLSSYEKGLRREKELNEKHKKDKKEKLRRQHEIDMKNKKENELKRYIYEDTVFGALNDGNDKLADNNEQLSYISNNVEINKNDSVSVSKNVEESFDNSEQVKKMEVISDTLSRDELNEKINQQGGNKENQKKLHAHIDSNEEKERSLKKKGNNITKMGRNLQHKKKKSVAGKNAKGGQARSTQNGQQQEQEQQKKHEMNRNKKEEEGDKDEEEDGNDEKVEMTRQEEEKEKKKIYYNSLLHKVLKNAQKESKKKEKYFKSFNFVTYFKLNELIYVSYLIEKYYNYYYKMEYYDLIDIYEEVKQRYKPHDGIDGSSCPSNVAGSKEEEEINCSVMDVKKEIELINDVKQIKCSDIFRRYEIERKNKQKQIYNKSTYKYIHSDYLGSYQFLGKKLPNIMNCVLRNLNLFFNHNINDIDDVARQYNTVVKNIEVFDVEAHSSDVSKEKLTHSKDNATCDNNLEVERTEEIIEQKLHTSVRGENKTNQQNGNVPSASNSSKGGENKKHTSAALQGELQVISKKNPNNERTLVKRHGNTSKDITKNKELLIGYEESGDVAQYLPNGNDLKFIDTKEFKSDCDISYLILKYRIGEVKNKNFIYYLTNDIDQVQIFKKTYFYDFFFMYMFRKLFWNILSLYNLHLAQYKSGVISSDTSSDVDGRHGDLLFYESDISVNNSKKVKSALYNTQEKLCHNLTPLFELIKREKLLIYLRYDENKRIKSKNKTECIYREIWEYLIFTSLKKFSSKGSNFPVNEFISFCDH
ncbi:conserved Plasmodium protein, unknown function [Plasmodium ovale]|uniref:Uncharacterized protein n=1 Tax=Plasmodium ovale TaxID=36330 RepID=A0A1D3TML9_PLAOA|nr:conserved Plasmodium protein, unknown function [Plasmodium ovale]